MNRDIRSNLIDKLIKEFDTINKSIENALITIHKSASNNEAIEWMDYYVNGGHSDDFWGLSLKHQILCGKMVKTCNLLQLKPIKLEPKYEIVDITDDDDSQSNEDCKIIDTKYVTSSAMITYGLQKVIKSETNTLISKKKNIDEVINL